MPSLWCDADPSLSWSSKQIFCPPVTKGIRMLIPSLCSTSNSSPIFPCNRRRWSGNGMAFRVWWIHAVGKWFNSRRHILATTCQRWLGANTSSWCCSDTSWLSAVAVDGHDDGASRYDTQYQLAFFRCCMAWCASSRGLYGTGPFLFSSINFLRSTFFKLINPRTCNYRRA